MVQQVINMGTDAHFQDGESHYTAFTKINENFEELYSGVLKQFQDVFTPSGGAEYPIYNDPFVPTHGDTWIVSNLTSSYLMTTGDLSGLTVDNGNEFIYVQNAANPSGKWTLLQVTGLALTHTHTVSDIDDLLAQGFITGLSGDTSPSLGGHLDVAGMRIYDNTVINSGDGSIGLAITSTTDTATTATLNNASDDTIRISIDQDSVTTYETLGAITISSANSTQIDTGVIPKSISAMNLVTAGSSIVMNETGNIIIANNDFVDHDSNNITNGDITLTSNENTLIDSKVLTTVDSDTETNILAPVIDIGNINTTALNIHGDAIVTSSDTHTATVNGLVTADIDSLDLDIGDADTIPATSIASIIGATSGDITGTFGNISLEARDTYEMKINSLVFPQKEKTDAIGDDNILVTGSGYSFAGVSTGTSQNDPATGTGGTGTGAQITVSRDSGVYTNLKLISGGTGYTVGDSIIFAGTNFAGVSPTNDLTLTVDAVTSAGEIIDLLTANGATAWKSVDDVVQGSQAINNMTLTTDVYGHSHVETIDKVTLDTLTANNVVGTAYYVTDLYGGSNGALVYWDGTVWKDDSVFVGTLAAINALTDVSTGKQAFDTDNNANLFWDGTRWAYTTIQVATSTIIKASATPKIGDMAIASDLGADGTLVTYNGVDWVMVIAVNGTII